MKHDRNRTQDERQSMAEYLFQAFSGGDSSQALVRRIEREEASKQGRLGDKRAA
jgi:hypothetical protein